MKRCSLVIPRAPDGKVLLCKRAEDKHPFPGVWCCAVGGKAESNESFEEAALREMKEEIGVAAPVTHVTSFVYDKEDYQAEFTVFTTETAMDKEQFTLDPNEIQYIEAFSISELQEMVEKEPHAFAPTFRTALEEFVKKL